MRRRSVFERGRIYKAHVPHPILQPWRYSYAGGRREDAHAYTVRAPRAAEAEGAGHPFSVVRADVLYEDGILVTDARPDHSRKRSAARVIELGHFLPGGTLLREEKGVSETYTGIIEVGERKLNAYVKFLSDRELVNELLGSVLARTSDLWSPPAFLVEVRRADYPASARFQASHAETIRAFATQALNLRSFNRSAELQSPEAKKAFVASWAEWPDVIGFDDWIANPDRHGGNFLIGEQGKVWLIDHGHSFTGPNWQIAALQPQCSVPSRLWSETIQAQVSLNDRHAASTRVTKAVSRFEGVTVPSAIEDAHIKTYLLTAENQALEAFLQQRRSTIVQRVCALLGVPQLEL